MANGLTGRKPGDIFKNQNGDIIRFDSLKFYPASGNLKLQELNSYLDSHNVYYENSPSSYCGVSLAKFDGSDQLSCRFFRNVNQDHRRNFIPNIVYGDYKLSSKPSEKTRSGITPQDLIEGSELSPDDVVRQLGEKLGLNHALTTMTKMVANNDPYPYIIKPPNNIEFEPFRDYFCEVVHPIALMVGNHSGNGDEAASKFLGTGFSNCKITYGNSQNTQFSDSTLSFRGKVVHVSSKCGNGAATSSVSNLQSYLAGVKADALWVVEDIVNNGQHDAPLIMGQKLGIIDENDATIIKSYRNRFLVDSENILDGLTGNLLDLAKNRDFVVTEVSMYNHLLAAVARKVADTVNADGKFSIACGEILNNTPLVQMYSNVTVNDGMWIVDGFTSLMPTSAVSDVKLVAKKSYYSSGVKGKYTFRIVQKPLSGKSS